MLEDIGKQDWVKDTIEQAKSIRKYIYNHSWVLNLMRKNAGNRELVQHAITRFATHFLTLQSLIFQEENLQKMFSCDEWISSKWARRKDANLIFQLLDEVVMEMGVANTVQIIIDNVSNYVLFGKMLESKHKTIFWTPCATHCIDLMLEDIGKQDWVMKFSCLSLKL